MKSVCGCVPVFRYVDENQERFSGLYLSTRRNIVIFFSRGSRTVAGISVLAVLFAAGGASTAALATSTAWSTPVNVSNAAQSENFPQVAVDGSGRATAVWQDHYGSNYVVQASTSLNGAPWSTPADLSATTQEAYNPQVTVDGSGRATAVWRGNDATNRIVQASSSLNGAAWSTPANLSPTGQDASNPQITVAVSGLATAVWDRYDGTNFILQASTSLDGAAWSAPANVSTAGQDASFPQITVDGSGLATAVWQDYDGANHIVQASTSLNGEAWSIPINLSTVGQDASSPQVAVDVSGRATAVWHRHDGTNYFVQASTSLHGAAWSIPVDLSIAEGDGSPQITVDVSGLATAVWDRVDGTNFTVQASTSLNGAAWSAPTNVSTAGQYAYDPQITVDGSGLATAVWLGYRGTNHIVQASTSLNGAAWSTPVDLSTAGQDVDRPQITTDGSGFATAVWQGSDGTNNIVQASFFDSRVENPTFADVDPSSPFYTYVQWMAATGISTGTAQPSGKPLYKPLDAVSRQAMALFVYRLSAATFIPPAVQTFADVPPGSPFYTAVEWMADRGISTGTVQPSGKPLFKPSDPVSRQAMALFLARYKHIDVSTAPATQSFADVPTNLPNFAAAIGWMKSTGISTGTAQPSGLPLYKPVDPVSRQAMAAFLYRLAHLPT